MFAAAQPGATCHRRRVRWNDLAPSEAAPPPTTASASLSRLMSHVACGAQQPTHNSLARNWTMLSLHACFGRRLYLVSGHHRLAGGGSVWPVATLWSTTNRLVAPTFVRLGFLLVVAHVAPPPRECELSPCIVLRPWDGRQHERECQAACAAGQACMGWSQRLCTIAVRE